VATTKSAIRLDEKILFSQFLLEKKLILAKKKKIFVSKQFDAGKILFILAR